MSAEISPPLPSSSSKQNTIPRTCFLWSVTATFRDPNLIPFFFPNGKDLSRPNFGDPLHLPSPPPPRPLLLHQMSLTPDPPPFPPFYGGPSQPVSLSCLLALPLFNLSHFPPFPLCQSHIPSFFLSEFRIGERGGNIRAQIQSGRKRGGRRRHSSNHKLLSRRWKKRREKENPPPPLLYSSSSKSGKLCVFPLLLLLPFAPGETSRQRKRRRRRRRKLFVTK